VHGTSALFSAAYGNVGSTPYYALGVTAAFALGLTPIAFLIAGLIFVCTAATYVEGTVMYPEAGGSSSFARHAFNEFVSFFAAWGQMLNYIITVAISAFFVPHYLAVFWSPLGEAPGDIIGGLVLIALLAALNVKGTQESARLNLILAIGDLLTQLALVVAGIFLVLSPDILVSNVELGVAPTWGNFALGIAVGMIAFTGIETISNMAEEAKDATRTVVRGTGLTFLAVLFMYALLPMIALSAMPVEQVGGEYVTELGTTYAADPVLGVVENIGLSEQLTEIGRYYVGVLAAVILVIATNAAMIGLSRLTFSMGQHRQLPERLRQVHPRFHTPYVAILVFSAIAAVTVLPGQADFLATMYSFGAMLSFTIAHVSLIMLRWRLAHSKMRKLPGDVEVEREEAWYRAPFNVRVRGVEVPVFAVLGGLGTFAAWIAVMGLYTTTLFVGAGWMVVGVATYFLYRRSKGLSVAQTQKIVMPPAVGAEPVRYAGVLVAFEEGTYSEDAMATALKLAAHKGGNILVLSTVTVPQHLSLDAPLEKAEQTAQAVIETARQWVGRGRRVRGRIAKVRQGEAGHRIVREAQEAHSDAIVMPMPASRPTGGKVLSKTLEIVLGKRPCRVIIDSAPAHPLTPDERPTAPRAPTPV
jgi:basic amino acid/polyamine antiporter, APA family